MIKRRLVNSHTVFISTLIVVATICLLVYLFGLKDHRSLYLNAILTTSILSGVFFIFIFTGLYNGWKLKDTLGDLTAYISKVKKPQGGNSLNFDSVEFLETGDSIEGCLFGIVIWIVVGLFGTIIFWFIGTFFWGLILIFAALLYWIIFRAYRLIFKNSAACKGNFLKSFRMALLFSLLYVSWIYAIIFISHTFVK